nr:MAG TPA: hypothetical protein [Caudoviricetes sp.]
MRCSFLRMRLQNDFRYGIINMLNGCFYYGYI